MHLKIGKFTTGLNDWLRYYVVQVGFAEYYLRKDGSIQFSTGISMYSENDKPDSGNFPTIRDAVKTIEGVGGTYECSSQVMDDIRTKLMKVPDNKLLKHFMEIEELCGTP